ncbi:MAG: phospholipase D-like domain-containing protein [Candidatus Thalassarchaeaceae archaeon]
MERGPARLAVVIIAVLTLSVLGSSQILQIDDSKENREAIKNSSCVVCINEIMPNADGSDQGIFPQGEWVELFNTGSSSVSLEGWTIVDIGGWTHPINETSWVGFSDLTTPYHIEAGAYAVIAENEIGTLRINNAGETIFLTDEQGGVVDEVTTGQASNGISKIPSNGSAEWIDSEQSTPGSQNIGGSDDENNPETPTDLQPSEWNGKYDVKFTRLMPGEVPNRDNDWFELSNLGNEVVNLTGWTIERIRSTTPWISTFNELLIPAGGSIVLTENPDNLFLDGGISAIDGNVVMNNMPWLVDSGSALQLKSPNGTVVDAVVYGGGDAEIEGWNGGAISVPGDGTPGLILMRGSGCGDNPDTNTGEDWEYRWIRIGASTFCDGGKITLEESSTVSASIGPDTSFNDLMHWIGGAETSIHLHVYQFMSPDLTTALLESINRGVSVTILLEEGILDGSSTKNKQKGHAQTLHDAGATVLWMEDPSLISSPYSYIHSKVAVRDTESVWISSGNWKDTSLPPDGVGNREWSVIVNSNSFAELVLSRLSWDENENHLHISPHSSNHAPTFDWEMEDANGGSFQETSTQLYSGPFEMQLMTCPDDCVDGIIEMIESADSTIELSLQYLDLDWYWGFGDNPIIEAIYQAAQRGVQVRLLLNGFYADVDDEIRDAVNLFNTNWNATEGLDVTARLMAWSDTITKLHNKGAIIDGESVLIGSMNWGSSAALRNREMGVLIHGQELASEYLQSFDEDWSRLDTTTDSDGDLLPDMWEIQYGLNRHSAAILGTALSEQSLDLDEDGLNNLNEYLWGGDPNDNDTDDDCILDGEEAEFAQSLGRSPVVAMNSNDVDDNGIPDGIQFGCDEEEIIDNNNGEGNNTNVSDEQNNDGENGGWIEDNVRDDPLSTPGAKFLLTLTVIAAISLVGAGLTMVRRPGTKTDSRLIDDSGYRFDDVNAEQAILKGTRFDDSSEDTRELTEGRDDGVHGRIVLDGFGFEKLDRDQVQSLLDKGMSIEELRDEYGEDEV